MSRRDIEELIRQLGEAGKDAPDRVAVERPLFNQAVEALGRLEQALDNRPSLIKKLNEKITKLEGELEILRNATRVNELEKKVQRLEGELQRSYATKNFTLKNGLLEIEKAYRDFIYGSPAVQCLWDEITLLLVEDKESLPQHILARRNQHMARGQTGDHLLTAITNGGAALESGQPSAAESPVQLPECTVAAEASEGQHSTSYVQQQVDKFKDYSFTPGPLDPHDPNHPINLHHSSFHPLYFPGGTPLPSVGGVAPDARATDVVDDRPVGLDALTQIREQYDEAAGGVAPIIAPHWGPMVPDPSPLRPVSLFSAGGEGVQRPPDASYVDACREELNSSLGQLRALFAQYDWAPTPLPGGAPRGSSQAPGQGGTGPGKPYTPPDASAFTSMADSLQVSVEKLRQYFGQMRWVPGAGLAGAGNGAHAATAASAATPDARYFDAQAEVILASVQRLRQQFQDAAASAAAAAEVDASGSHGAGWSGAASGANDGTASGPAAKAPAVIPDARYFETQADAIAASVDALLRLYERSSGGAAAWQGAGGSYGPWPAGVPPVGARTPGAGGVVPDARAGDMRQDELDASVQPLIDLFSAFMGHLQATQGSAGASGPWPLAPYAGGPGAAAAGRGDGADGLAAEGGVDDADAEAAAAQQRELLRMFVQYLRSQAWPAAAAATAAMRRVAASVGGAGPASRAVTPLPAVSPLSRPGSQAEHLHDGAARGFPTAGGPIPGTGFNAAGTTMSGAPDASGAAAAPVVRFRISYHASADGGIAVGAHLAPAAAGLASVLEDAAGPGSVHAGAPGDALSPAVGGNPVRSAFATAASTAAAAVAAPAAAYAAGGGAPTAPVIPGTTITTTTTVTPVAGPAASSKMATAPSNASGTDSSPLEVLLHSLESRHGRSLASSPDAVAVWRDLLMLLGVDPDSRPLPGSAAGAKSGKSTARKSSRSKSAASAAVAQPAAAAEASAEAPYVATGAQAGAVAAAVASEVPSASGWEAAGAAGASMVETRALAAGNGFDGSTLSQPQVHAEGWQSEGADQAEVVRSTGPALRPRHEAGQGPEKGAGAAVDAGGTGRELAQPAAPAAANGVVPVDGHGSADGGGEEQLSLGHDRQQSNLQTTAAGATLAAAAAAATSTSTTEGLEPEHGDGRGSETGGVVESGQRASEGIALGGEARTGGREGSEGATTGHHSRSSDDGAPMAGETGEAANGGGADANGQGPSAVSTEDVMASAEHAEEATHPEVADGSALGSFEGEGVAIQDDAVDEGQEAQSEPAHLSTAPAEDGSGEAAEVVPAPDGQGLIAGGVRFQITLSEITAVAEETAQLGAAGRDSAVMLPSASSLALEQQQQPEQQLVQFRARIDGGDAAAAEEREAELAQLKQVRHSLSEQLAATQDLVLHLNRQLKGALESREDLAARAERLTVDLNSALADAEEARHESDVFMRDLVETKVKLAEVQGEYMQVYQALKRALGNEKDMMAKIDELERILAVVGPGDISVDEEYASTVGQVSATVTPREDLGGLGMGTGAASAAATPAPASQPGRMGMGFGMGLGWGYSGGGGAEHVSAGGAGVVNSASKLQRIGSARTDAGVKGPARGPGSRGTSYGGRSVSSGSGRGSGGGGSSGGGSGGGAEAVQRSAESHA